jgi:acyl transferase domain-containing protein
MNVSEHSRDGRRLADDPIAIVGVSSLFPMARNHRDYWQNIIDGTDCTTEVPEDRWRSADYFDPDPAAPDKTYSRRGGFIPDVAFNPLEFAIPPNQLDVTSTCQTLSLGVARDLLRDAGANDSSWYDPARTGVVLGVTGPVPLMHPLAARLSTPVLKEVVRAAGLTEADAKEIAERYVRAFAPWEENSFPGLLANVVAGRVANRLDLGGLNSTVDAACAASLSALRMAIAELTDRRADTMIAGGVDTENSIFIYMCFAKVGALSRTDRISPLSDQADGTLVGEGIGMLALRRLADAERDGNRIYAVIRGLGSSSDGRAKSIYAPRAEGQRLALHRAYEDADCSPASVELFEAHATGTAVGDRTELTALSELLTENAADRHSAAIGSIKSQIGHTKGAAGTASLIKLAFSLYHKILPPTINVERPNGYIDFACAPFYVNVMTRPWIRDPHRPVRRAAASAMGFGGTNFHVVLEEHDGHRSVVRNLHRTARAHLWHAPDPAALAELLRTGAPAADGGPVPVEHARLGFVAADEQAAARLRALAAERLAADPEAGSWSVPQGIFYRRRARPDLRVGALFAGQGSQYLNMGLEAALNVPPVGGAFDEANEVFAGQDTRLGHVVYPPPVFDPALRQAQEATLRLTQYAQPAIGALSAGQFRFLRELGLECASFAGHSFGELTALWAAGSLTDADYFRLAAARGAAMAARTSGEDPGAMAVITADREQVTQILAQAGSDAVLCNHNAPDQVVVGGGTAAVEAVVSACSQAGITARKLPVSAAFHTCYVAHAVDAFRAAAEAAQIGAPAAPVHANSPGASYGPDPARNAETLTAQLLQPVEFVAAVRAMRADDVTVFVEFGPKQVLTGLVRRILDGDDVAVIATDAGPLGDADVALKQAAVQLAVLGAPLTGINRYDEPELADVKPSGMTVTLSAAEYVPPARHAAYLAGLTDGFQVTLPAAPAPDGPAPAPDRVEVPVRDAGPVEPAGPSGNGHASPSGNGAAHYAQAYQAPVHYPEVHYPEVHYAEEQRPMSVHPSAARQAEDDPAAQHLALHSRYLESQLQVAETLLGLVTEHGLDHPQLPRIAESIKDQSVAIGSAHARAAEVLARLTELELGAAPAGYALADFPAAPAPAASHELPSQRHAIAPVPQPASVPEPQPAPRPPLAPAPVLPPPLTAVSPATSNRASNGASAPAGYAPAAPVQVAPAPAAPAPAAHAASAAAQPTGPRPTVPEASAAQSGVDAGSLRAALIGIVAEKTGYPPDMIDPSLDLEAELGVDSIKRVQVIGAVQEQFDGLPTVGPEQLSEMRTLDMMVDFMAGGAGDAGPKAPSPAAKPASGGDAAPVPRYPVQLIDLPAIDTLAAPYGDDPVAVVVHRGGPDGAAVARALTGHGWTVRQSGGPLDGGESFAAAISGQVNAVVMLVSDDHEPTWADATRRLTEVVLVAKHAQAPLASAGQDRADSGSASPGSASSRRAAFVTVTRLDGGLGLEGAAPEAKALLGGAAGVVKTLAIEAPELFCRALDIHPGLDPDRTAAVLLDELRDAATDTIEVGVDAGLARRTVTPGRYHLGQPPDSVVGRSAPADLDVRSDDVFVVTGGARGITALCVTELAATRPAEFILLGRTELAAEPPWAQGVPGAGLKAAAIAAARAAGNRPAPRDIERQYADLTAQREIRATLADLAAAGSAARYLAVDVTDAAAVGDALAGQRVTGVIHGAGVLADAFLSDKTTEQVERVLRPKLGGLAAVLAAVDAGRLRHLVLFTSVAGLLGNAGQADYAAANEALCRFAASWKHRHPGQHVVAIDWGAWDGGMVTPSLRAALSARGVPLLDPVTGARAFTQQFSASRAGQSRVLIGEPTGLSSGPLAGGGPRTARRELSGVEADEVIRAHRIGAREVLPASFGLGWLINTAERAYPGTSVVRVRDFQVFRGIVFDDTQASEYLTELGAAAETDGKLVAQATVRGADASGRMAARYGAVLELAAAPEPAERLPVPAAGPGAGDALSLYTSGVLFHGPRLQGIRDILEFTDDRLVLRCRLADAAVARGAFAGARHSPVLTDILLQGALALNGRTREPSLPLGVTRADYYAPLPDDEDFLVVIDQLQATAAGASVDATAADTSGRLLVRFSGIALVPTPDMAAKFAEAVGHWRTQLELACPRN